MKGFFTKRQTQSTSRPGGRAYSCASCGLYKNVLSPRINAYGDCKKGIIIVGEAPGETEDKRGKPWQGKMGRLLQRTLKKHGINLFEDCLSINAVNCRPLDEKGNRAPTGYEINCCRRRVLDTIKEYQPKMILLLGGAAIDSVLGPRWDNNPGPISKWRGWQIPDQQYKAWICPTFHPSFVERGFEEVETIWNQDLEQAFETANKPLVRFKTPNIQMVDDLRVLDKVSTMAAVDFETTGLKPHARGHRIICASVAYGPYDCYAFMMPATRKKRAPLLRLLSNESVQKTAHNFKYEENWSVVRLKQPVKPWGWDSMLAAHVLDNRSGVCSLDFQSYVHFGIDDYSSEITPYLKSTKNANEHNRIHELIQTRAGREKLMYYCGMDTILQYRLTNIQMRKLGEDFLPF